MRSEARRGARSVENLAQEGLSGASMSTCGLVGHGGPVISNDDDGDSGEGEGNVRCYR